VNCDKFKSAQKEVATLADLIYTNHYRCPRDGAEWKMVWNCMCDDRCPVCGWEIVPYKSDGSPVDDTKVMVAHD
jgi:hypothetical protein